MPPGNRQLAEKPIQRPQANARQTHAQKRVLKRSLLRLTDVYRPVIKTPCRKANFTQWDSQNDVGVGEKKKNAPRGRN